MQHNVELRGELSIPFVCPSDRATLFARDGGLACPDCGTLYPVVGGVPVLIDDDASVFSRADYQRTETAYEGPSYGSGSDRTAGLRGLYRRAMYRVFEHSVKISTTSPEQAIAHIRADRSNARILVIGAGDADFGEPGIFYTDVAFGSRVGCICDAHGLPFPDGWFDGVMAVAVLEHVADPNRCAEEIRRVLAPGGYVYAVTPFLQPVHMGAHDFTRFTYLGHRRLFRWFDDIDSGASLGPAASTFYALKTLLLSFSDGHTYRRLARLAAMVLLTPIKECDRLTRRRQGCYEGAAGFFFFGRLRERPLTDKEVIGLYRGAD